MGNELRIDLVVQIPIKETNYTVYQSSVYIVLLTKLSSIHLDISIVQDESLAGN